MGDIGGVATAIGTLVALGGVIVSLVMTRRGQEQERELAEASALRAEAAARVSEDYTSRVVEALERMASGQLAGDVTEPRVKWSLTHQQGDTYMLENVGTARAIDVQVTEHPILIGPDRIVGGPDLDEGEALTSMAARVLSTEDSTIRVTWRIVGDETPRTWEYPLPPRPRRGA